MTDPIDHGPSYGQIDHEYGLRLAATPPADDGPIWMVNLMAYRAKAVYDGQESERSGREADEEYAPVEILADIGAEIVFVGDVEDQFLGDQPSWDRVAVVKYPSRRSFIEMQQREDFQAKHVHKEAGMAATIVAGCTPMDVPQNDIDPANLVDWSEVPHPSIDEDGPAMILHLIRYEDGGADIDMVSYQNHAGTVAVPHGVRIAGWFDVEGTIIGDGREWDQARFNLFPSKAAFLATVMDPGRLEAQKNHREVAIADTYTLLIRPMLDRLEESRQS